MASVKTDKEVKSLILEELLLDAQGGVVLAFINQK